MKAAIRLTLAFAAASLLSPVDGSRAGDSLVQWANMQGEVKSRSRAAEFARWLVVNNDVVFLGRFESWTKNTTPYSGGAVLRCRIDSLVSGYSLDSVVTFSTLMAPHFSPDRLGPDTRVLGWFLRGCAYDGGPCGDINVIGEDGRLLHDYSDSDDVRDREKDPRPLRWVDLPRDTLRAGDIRAIVGGASGLASVTLSFEARLPSGDVVLGCADGRWIVPGREPLPTRVRFRPGQPCGWEPRLRYLIPVPPGYRGDTLALGWCPHAGRVKAGEVMALGVPVDSLASFLVRGPGGTLCVRDPDWVHRDQGH